MYDAPAPRSPPAPPALGLGLLAVLAATLGGCPTTTEPGTDGGGSVAVDGGGVCTLSSQCSDGRFCNGLERCAPGEPAADERGCAPGDAPCGAMPCDEIRDRCVAAGCEDPDADGDGADRIACGGLDCDDDDPARWPGALEVCDPDDHDEDCDPTTFGVRDADGDGAPDAACCNADAGGTARCGDDCDDARAGVAPGRTEVCNDRDDDCDGMTDEGVVPTYWPDADGDGFGSAEAAAEGVTGCVRPVGYAETRGDCDDAVGSTHPGAFDACDLAAVDDDCSGTPNDPPAGCACTDGATEPCGLEGVCSAGVVTCVMGRFTTSCSIAPAPAESACDARDEDCDGVVDDGVSIPCYRDRDDDGYPDATATTVEVCANPGRFLVNGCPVGHTNRAPGPTSIDCDDVAMDVFPRAAEVCDARDNDCDGAIDEGVGGLCYADGDRDSYAPLGAATSPQPCGAACPAGTTARAPVGGDVDCNDGAAGVHPNAAEICNRVDDDCSLGGGPDTSEDVDGDGHAARSAPCTSAGGGLPHDDCNDASALVFPGQTMWFSTPGAGDPTGFDYDCDGVATREHTTYGGCYDTGSCSFNAGWSMGAGIIPGCGVAGQWLTGCNSSCFSGSTTSRTQACH